MRLDRRLLVAVIGLATVASLAGCGKAAPTTLVLADEQFQSLDRNGDGRLSRAEAGLGTLVFSSMDRNRDEALSPLEWQGGRENPDNAYQTQIQTEEQRRPNTAPPPVY